SCRAKADRGRTAECPDARTAAKLEKTAVVLGRGISRGCDAAQIAALAPGTGGTTAACFAGSDVEALAACLAEAVVTTAEPVLATIQDVQAGPRFRFEIPAGTLSLRLTLNGVDRTSGTPNDLDLYVRFATEPSVFEFDAAGTRQ